MCAACGRELEVHETVYIEVFEDARGKQVNLVTAPVGIECSSDELRDEAAEREPERCAGCGRAVYYRVERDGRRRALCSRVCRKHALRIW